ncbi:MAG: putative esterase [Verrucomicrobiales bacterium]|nr:putative esterase [Verrucomicrobiales bacterium]
MIKSLLLVSLMAVSPGVFAQTAVQNPPRQIAPITISPEVHADGTVTFRVPATNATKVTVGGDWAGGSKEMTKGENGIWSVTMGPLPPEIYSYSLNIDGVAMIDPNNVWVKPMRAPRTSVFEIPGIREYDFQKVAHGTVRSHQYESTTLNRLRSLTVYTPPGYDQNSKEKYPVLYLLHGSGDNDATWISVGRANNILDNLMSDGKARKMIVVMTDGHAIIGPQGTNRMANVSAYEKDLFTDVMPFVEHNYRTKNESKSRAIVGLSMGGGQSLNIGLNHTETFAWVGGMSASIYDPETNLAKALNDSKKTNKQLKLLWFQCGKDDRLVANASELSAILDNHQIKHAFKITEGNHSWPVWRKYLVEFVPLIFQD